MKVCVGSKWVQHAKEGFDNQLFYLYKYHSLLRLISVVVYDTFTTESPILQGGERSDL